MDLSSIGQLLGGALGGGGVGTIASTITEALKLINHLTADDPVKQAAANRAYIMKMVEIVKEVRHADTGFDMSDFVITVTKLMDA